MRGFFLFVLAAWVLTAPPAFGQMELIGFGAGATATGGGGGGGATVLESFEGTPLTGVLTWTQGPDTGTVTSTTSHVTQGAKTWRVQGSDGLSGEGFHIDSGVNLTGYTTITVDVFIQSLGAGGTGYVEFYVSDSGFSCGSFEDSPNLSTGAFTLTANISDCSDKTDMAIFLDSFEDGGSVDWYADNLLGTP